MATEYIIDQLLKVLSVLASAMFPCLFTDVYYGVLGRGG